MLYTAGKWRDLLIGVLLGWLVAPEARRADEGGFVVGVGLLDHLFYPKRQRRYR